MVIFMWLLYAILSSIFASIMTILMKLGLKNIDSILATTLRTTFVFLLLWILVLFMKRGSEIKSISNKEWLYLFLSSIATCATWIFYFLALKKTDVSKVIAIDRLSIVFTILLSVLFLKEKLSVMTIIGVIVLVGGTLLVVFG